MPQCAHGSHYILATDCFGILHSEVPRMQNYNLIKPVHHSRTWAMRGALGLPTHMGCIGFPERVISLTLSGPHSHLTLSTSFKHDASLQSLRSPIGQRNGCMQADNRKYIFRTRYTFIQECKTQRHKPIKGASTGAPRMRHGPPATWSEIRRGQLRVGPTTQGIRRV